MKPTAKIEDWQLFNGRLFGKITEHPNKHTFIGEYQMTSDVIKFDLEFNHAETKNTIYVLGKPSAKE